MKVPVFDFHCDTALALLGPSANEAGSLRQNHLHVDLVRASALEAYCQCFACFTTPAMQDWYGVSPTVMFERELAGIQREVAASGGQMALAYSADEITKNRGRGIMSALLTLEGPAGFGYDPDLLQDLYAIGFRITTLGWNEQGPLTGSCVTGGGLTDRGKAYVKEAQRLGMLVDVSHISDEGFYDILDMSVAPVIASHSNSRAVCNHARNLTDDMFRRLCLTGGIAGINQYADFIGEKPTIDTVCDHILHFLEMDPTGEHVALGGDLDGCDTLSAGFEGIQSYPALADCLRQRGVTDEMIHNIFWRNAVRVLAAAEKSACS